MDVGPLVIPDAQTAKLIEPGKGPLYDPPPPAQAAPVRGTTHSEPRHDMPRPQPTANRRRIVAAIPEHSLGADQRSAITQPNSAYLVEIRRTSQWPTITTT